MTPQRRRLLLVLAGAYLAALAAALVAGAALAGRHPLLVTGLADVAATVAVFAFSWRHDNSSVYDPYWSVAPLPILGAWLVLAEPGAPPLRAGLASALVLLWGLRLTWNCLARWRSLGDEDFRYGEIRARTGAGYWPASLLTIHLLPTGWVFLGLVSLYPALARPGRPVGWIDLAATILTGGAVLLEAVADAQLRRFLGSRREPDAVLETGLWAISRHPNYLGEVLFWWGLWLFGLAADPAWWWTVAGPLAITALFTLVSVPWMDRRLEARHPGWLARRSGVPALWPRSTRRTRGAPDGAAGEGEAR